jgi:hypothetical protein
MAEDAERKIRGDRPRLPPFPRIPRFIVAPKSHATENRYKTQGGSYAKQIFPSDSAHCFFDFDDRVRAVGR